MTNLYIDEEHKICGGRPGYLILTNSRGSPSTKSLVNMIKSCGKPCHVNLIKNSRTRRDPTISVLDSVGISVDHVPYLLLFSHDGTLVNPIPRGSRKPKILADLYDEYCLDDLDNRYTNVGRHRQPQPQYQPQYQQQQHRPQPRRQPQQRGGIGGNTNMRRTNGPMKGRRGDDMGMGGEHVTPDIYNRSRGNRRASSNRRSKNQRMNDTHRNKSFLNPPPGIIPSNQPFMFKVKKT